MFPHTDCSRSKMPKTHTEMYDGKIISLPELKKSGYQHEVDSVSTGLNIDKNDEVKQGETSDETI